MKDKSILKTKKNSKLKKIILLSLIFIIIIIGGGLGYLLLNINSIVKKTIERSVSQTTLTDVEVKKVNIKLKNRSGQVGSLTIANPKGFKGDNCFSLKTISLKIDLSSIKKRGIILQNVYVLKPKIFVEINQKNQNNLLIIKKNISKTSGSSIETDDPEILIRHFELKGAEVSALIGPLNNKKLKFMIPKIQIKNLKGTVTEITKIILNTLIKQTVNRLKGKGINILKDKINTKISDLLKENIKL